MKKATRGWPGFVNRCAVQEPVAGTVLAETAAARLAAWAVMSSVSACSAAGSTPASAMRWAIPLMSVRLDGGLQVLELGHDVLVEDEKELGDVSVADSRAVVSEALVEATHFDVLRVSRNTIRYAQDVTTRQQTGAHPRAECTR